MNELSLVLYIITVLISSIVVDAVCARYCTVCRYLQCVLCAGNAEAARQVLKRASELKILNSEQIASLTAALAEECSASIVNGQILDMF